MAKETIKESKAKTATTAKASAKSAPKSTAKAAAKAMPAKKTAKKKKSATAAKVKPAVKRVAIVGFGFMGRMHFGHWKKQRGFEVVALCDKNTAQFTEGIEGGNLAGADNSTDYGKAVIYDDFDKMLAEAKPDVIALTLPTPLHVPLTVQALKAGVSVLCEKPMALNAKLCNEMVAAAAEAPDGAQLMVGHCLRFWPCYTYLKKLIDTQKYGSVVAASFKRYSAMPGWGKGANWFMDESKSGGVALDLHIHDADMVNFLFGMPKSVTSSANYNSDGLMTFITTLYDVGDAVVSAEGCWAMTQSFGFEASYMVTFENAVAVMNTNAADALVVYPAKGKKFVPKLKAGDGYAHEIKWFADKLKGLEVEPVITPEQSRDSVRIIDAEKRSAKSGRKVAL
ncbi:MAG: Gfo/Idh/MocA family oxidoreductase [Kiritimatiellae bacterium]|nr:Gfo/Idh/MocA family oxidoreductase [Kiritimatiellia bacterium]